MTKPIITPRGAQRAMMVVALAFSWEGNHIVATLEGIERMKV